VLHRNCNLKLSEHPARSVALQSNGPAPFPMNRDKTVFNLFKFPGYNFRRKTSESLRKKCAFEETNLICALVLLS